MHESKCAAYRIGLGRLVMLPFSSFFIRRWSFSISGKNECLDTYSGLVTFSAHLSSETRLSK